MKLESRYRVLIIAMIVIGGLVLLGKMVFFPATYVPTEFTEARLEGATIAQKIVTLSGGALASLEKISEYDKNGETAEALILISQQLIANRVNQEEAVKLSRQLEKMARFLSNIKPANARQQATEAVTSEVALVSRLISYNDYLKQLFEVLSAKFNHRYSNVYESRDQVEGLIQKVNEEAQAINEFDGRFNKALAELDKIVL